MNTIAIFIAQYLYLVVLLIGVIFFFTRPRKIQKNMAVCGVIIAPLSYIIAKIAGAFYYNPRPFVVGHFAPLIAHVADNGFPSDHVLLTGAVAMVVFFYNKKLGGILWILAALIGIARVYAGIHHLTDILGSIVIVLVSSVAYYFLIRRRDRHTY